MFVCSSRKLASVQVSLLLYISTTTRIIKASVGLCLSLWAPGTLLQIQTLGLLYKVLVGQSLHFNKVPSKS